MILGFCAVAFGTFSTFREARAETIQEFLRAFNENPASVMQRLPPEVDDQGKVHSRGFINHKKVQSNLATKTAIRSSIMAKAVSSSQYYFERRSFQPMAALPADANEKDLPERLIDPNTPILRNLNEMQSRGLMSVSAVVMPWSDSYWPTYKGQIGIRYSDPGFPNSNVWEQNYQYILRVPASSIINSGDAALIDNLSPSEKYDFVVGDSDFTLTKFAWKKGEDSLKQWGSVSKWLGLCHGWAAAAHLYQPLTEAPIVVHSTTGVPVKFYPQDIKALTTMLWANSSVPTRFVGHKCTTANPPKNANGRILDPKCFDPNPATWHLAIVNQMGINKRPFIMDSTYDYQVWNFPLASAKYRYFNSITYEDTDVLARAAIPIENIKLDHFREFRSPQTKYVVGVYMDLTYVVEVEPSHRNVSKNPTKTIRLIYDLELDGDYNVIGGEWYSNAHPDFLWTHDANAQATTREDSQISEDTWNNDSPIPGSWTTHASRASAQGQPLFTFVRKVIESSKVVPTTGPTP